MVVGATPVGRSDILLFRRLLMRQFTPIIAVGIFCIILALSCAGSGSPSSPGSNTVLQSDTSSAHSNTVLWGLYDVYIDLPSQIASTVLNRQAMFTANVVNFINGKPASLGFKINGTPIGTNYIDVDIDVSITHPFPGLPQYNGYDVRGIFMGDGSKSLGYNSALIYPVAGSDQFMFPDPVDSFGGPDGYTRWFNAPEFSGTGLPLFLYTKGKVATPGFLPTATLNPYKYFATGLGTTQNLWAFMNSPENQRGLFASGATLTRNYYLRFPSTKNVKFAYAITANWAGTEPQYHPSNAPEAVACSVNDNSDIWYADPTSKGGNLNLNISLWDWKSTVSGGVMEDYKLFIDSTVLSSVHAFTPSEMTPTGGGEHYSTYQIDIPADNINNALGNEYWVIAECSSATYANENNIHNKAENDKLAAFFRFDLATGSEPGNELPVCGLVVVTPMPAQGWTQVPVEFDASTSYDPEGTALTYEWDFDGDSIYSETPDDSFTGTPVNPTHDYSSTYTDVVHLKLTDQDGKSTVCTTSPLDVTIITGCPATAVPSGNPASHYVTSSNTARSGVTRAVGTSGKEYFIGHKRDYYAKQYGFYAMDETGTIAKEYMSPPQPDFPPTLQGMASDSNGRIYAITYTQYIYSSDTLYYVDFDESSGFSGLLQTASMPSIAPWYFVKITVDQNDNPVALVGNINNTQLAIKHWNGSSWTHIDIADYASMYTENGLWTNGIEDIAYQPVTDEYWITNRYHGYTPNYEGTPTLYVIKNDGTTDWKNSSIYPGVPPYSQFSVGVDIDVNSPDCRTLVLICCGSTGTNQFIARFVRYDPFGNATGAGLMANGTPRYEFANGVVITNAGTSWYSAPIDSAGSYVGTTQVPDW
jgi:hypothetical protein